LYANGKLAANLSNFEHKSKLSNSVYMYMDENFYGMYSDLVPGAKSFSPYGSLIGSFSEDTGKLYADYFGENHFYMGVDGMETFTYTKGEGNSLVRMMMYSDAIVKEMAKMTEQYK
jgi:hypothetical protein